MDWNEDSDDEDDHMAYFRIGPHCLYPDSSKETVSSFFFDMDFMSYPNLEALLTSFEFTMESLSECIIQMDNDNFYFDKQVLKMVLKYRHNIFSDIFKQCCGIVGPINTDVSLASYGSEKTPDLLIENENEIIIVEFTVASTRERVEYNKGGGLHPLKYSAEAAHISKVENKKCEVIIVYLTTKESNIDEMRPVCDRLGADFDLFKESCNRFLSVLAKHNMVIMPVVSLSFIQEYIPTIAMEKSFEKNKQYLGNNAVSFSEVGLTQSEYISLRQSILNWHKGLEKNSMFKRYQSFLTTIELHSGQLKIEYVSNSSLKKGLDKDTLLFMIQSMDISGLLVNSKIMRKEKRVNLSSLSGNISYIVPKIAKIQSKDDVFVNDQMNLWRYENVSPVYNYMLSKGTSPQLNLNNFLDYSKKVKENCGRFDKYPDNPVLVGHPKTYLFCENYMEQLLTKINPEQLSLSDNNKTLLSSNVLNETTINECSSLLTKSFISMNTNIKIREKRSFVIPLPTGQLQYGKLDEIDYTVGSALGFNNEFTREAFRLALNGKFVQVDTDERLLELNITIAKGESELNNMLRERYSESQKVPRRHEIYPGLESTDPLKIKIDNLKKVQHERKKVLIALPKQNRTTRTIRLKNRGNSRMASAFNNEMLHYQRKEGIAGVGLTIDHLFHEINNDMNSLFSWLVSKPSENAVTKIFDKNHGPGPQFLTDHKKLMLNGFEQIHDDFLESNLAKVLEFASRLAHTLFKLSTLPLNGEHVTFDNLGYDNVWLLVKGGKKMYRTSTTKLFRIIHPSDMSFEKISGINDDHYKFTHDGVRMVCTPWMQIHSSILKDTHSIYHRIFMDIAISLKRCKKDFEDISKADLLTCLLAFHQKRQTEVALHNMRYLIVNPTGEFSNLSGIIPSFASVNYSYFDAWIKKSIEKNFVEFSMSMMTFKNAKTKRIVDALKMTQIKNIITNEIITEPYELVSMIYMTYTMSKGQYNRAVEQASNWKGVCEDVFSYNSKHSLVDGLNDVSLRFELDKNNMEAYEDDFVYDPAFCQYLGYRLKNKLLKKTGKHKIWEYWSQSINKSITNIANKNGLRGFNEKNFFNKKGYEIITDFFVTEILNGNIAQNMAELNIGNERDKIKELKSRSQSIGDVCIKYELTEAIFHIVEKKQRSGNREIYVMDIFTKFYQNPIEDFFGKICKEVDSEVISIPSDVRPSMMHTLYYENDNKWADHIYNLVLDCRRWAPHSNFQKYFHFIHGMSEILPDSFIKHFSFFFDKMIKKKVLTRNYVVESFKNNEAYSSLFNIMTTNTDKTKGSWSIVMEFSFMMGMFNYLSSLMHAANQMFIADFSRIYIEKKFGVCSNLTCLAHSDDSTAKFYFKSPFTSRLNYVANNNSITENVILKDLLTLYDWLLKGANHMISVKKSVVSKIYQEFLSMLYLFGENVSVLKKFTGTISFEATDQGYSNDVSYSVSKCLEMLQNGGTLDEVYFSMKISETYIRSFYGLPTADPNIPFEFMGLLDCHPIEAWLMGTKAEMYKHIVYNRENVNRCLSALTEDVFVADRDVFDFSLKWDMGSRLSPHLRNKVAKNITGVDPTLMNSWTIKNGKFNNIYPYYLWYCSKIFDPKFYSSMISDDIERRMARIYGAFNSRSIKTDFGSHRAVDVYELIKLSMEGTFPDKIGKFLEMLSPVMREMDYFWEAAEQLNGIKLNYNDANLTLKPTRLNHRPPIIGNNLTINSSKLVTHMKEPELYWLYGDETDPSNKAKVVRDYFKMVKLNPDDMSCDDLRYVIEKICGLQSKAKRILAYSSSDNRNLMSMESIFELIATNSCYGKKIMIAPRILSGLDNEYFNTKAGIPVSVISFSKMYWLSEKIRKLDSKLPLLLPTFYEDMEKLKLQIDVGWKELVSSTSNDCKLNDIMYWSTWLLSQKRLAGGIWAGKGQQFHRTIEFVCTVSMEGRLITNFQMTFENQGPFSRATQWYLEAVMNNDVGLKENMTSSDSFQIGKNYLCFNEDSGVWGINDRSSRCLVLMIDEDCNPPSWFNLDVDILRLNGKLSINYKGAQVQIKSVLDRPFQSIKVLRKYLNLPLIRENKDDLDLRRIMLDLQKMFFDIPVLDPINFFQRILSSRIYNMLYDSDDTKYVMLRAAIRYKEQNPSFLFPDSEMLSNYVNSGNIHQMPESLVNSLRLIPKLKIDDNFKKMAFEEFYQAVIEGEVKNQGILNNLQTAFLDKTQNAITRILSVNINMYYILSLSLKFGYTHIEWLCDLIDMICLYKEVSPLTRKEQIFKQKNIFSKCIGYILYSVSYIERSSYIQLFVDILNEMLDAGLLGFLQIERKASFISTDFNSIGRERFVQMFKNLLCNIVTVKGNFFSINSRKPLHQTDELYQKIYVKADIKFWQMRSKFQGLDLTIIDNIDDRDLKKKKYIRPSNKNFIVKMCSNAEHRKTCSDDPDDIDEAMSDFLCGDDPYLNYELSDGMYHTYKSSISGKLLMLIGGTAKTIMIKTHNILGCIRKLKFFNKISIFSPNLTNSLEAIEERILVIHDSKKILIEGYTKVKKHELHNYFRPKNGTEVKYSYDGQHMGRDIFKTANHVQFEKLSAYSKKLYDISIDPKIASKLEFLNKIVEIQPNEEQLKLRKMIKDYASNIYVSPESKFIAEINERMQGIDVDNLKIKLTAITSSIKLIPQPTMMSISDDVDLIQDEKLLSEGDVFSTQLLNKLIRGSVRFKSSQFLGIRAVMDGLVSTYKNTAFVNNIAALNVIIQSILKDAKKVRSGADDQAFDDIMDFLEVLTSKETVSIPRPRAEDENFALDMSFFENA